MAKIQKIVVTLHRILIKRLSLTKLYMSELRNRRIAVGAIFMAQGLIFASWASRIPDIKNILMLSDGQLGSLLFSIPIGQGVSIIPAGWLAAKFGSKRITAIAVVMYALVLASLSLATGFWSLAALLFCMGFWANTLGVSVNTQAVFVESLYPRKIMSSFHGMWSLGGLMGGIIGAGFAMFLPALPWHFTTIFAGCLLLIFFANRHLMDIKESADKGETEDFNIRRVDSYLWFLGIIVFASMFCEGITYDWSSIYFDSVIHADSSLIRLGYVAGLGAVTLGRFISDRFVQLYGAPKILMCCGCSLLLGFLIVVGMPYLVTATLGFFLVGLGISSICPVCMSMAGNHPSVKTSTAITIVSSIGFIGFLMAPPVIGWVSETIGLRLTTLFGAIGGLLVILVARKLENRD